MSGTCTDEESGEDPGEDLGSAAAMAEEGATVVENTVLIRSAVLSCILLLMVLYTMYFAATLIVPIVLAFLLSLVFTPLVRVLTHLHVPRTVSALVIMLAVGMAILGGIYAFAQPAAQWMDRAPAELHEIQRKLSWIQEPISDIKKAKEEVKSMAGGDEQADASASTPSFSVIDFILGQAPDIIFGAGVMLILLFFLLSSGDAFITKMVEVTPTLDHKKRVVETARSVQHHVSIYLVTLTGINLCVGIVVAIAMYLLDVPNPLLWGAMLAVLNFIPYIGVAISIIVVTFVSLLTFDSALQILAPGAVILVVNIIEGQFITPIVAGRRLALSPVAVFLSLVVLGWIWGMLGVLMAVPVLATVKLVCERIEPLEPVATFLAHR